MNRREARLHKMKQKRENDLEEARKGVKFPEYNPPPTRNLTSKREIGAAKSLKKSEKKRNETKMSNRFTGWEYKDRYSYKKT